MAKTKIQKLKQNELMQQTRSKNVTNLQDQIIDDMGIAYRVQLGKSQDREDVIERLRE